MHSDINKNKELRNQRIKMVVIISLFALPVVVAWLWHVNSDQWRPANTTNYGELITPARPLKNLSIPDLNGTLVTQEIFRGHWTLLYIGTAACDQLCQTNLYNIRQLRIKKNEKMDRVQRLWIISGEQASEQGSDQLADLLRQHPGLQVVKPGADILPALLEQFRSTDAHSAVEGRVYLVDPLGNLMMRYPVDAKPKGILKDIERLLKTSWIG